MKKYQCIVCGWIYDEAEGWPQDGIVAGTKWDDIPDDWTCPDCAEEVDRLRRKPGIRLDASQHYLGGLSGAAAPFRYEGCVRRAILRAKYQAAPWTAVELGVVLAELAFGSEVRMRGAEPVPQRVEGARLGYDCIVPVPASSRSSERSRSRPSLLTPGWSSMRLIASCSARSSGV